MTSRGSAAEGILLKMLLDHGIEAEHGSPSRPGDIIVPPNIIIEIKDPKENAYSFKQHSSKGEEQWKVLRAKVEAFPWLEIYYAVRFGRKNWRYFPLPGEPKPLRAADGNAIENLFAILKAKQELMLHAVNLWNYQQMSTDTEV